eukprot:Plantae.Rhodophyta-Purpureofilum_apyrenoidigerum.ctg37212.p1 GENE.Plantae.Rhodophyta-Purpureofilum_apyrenoidigerum.ctg37212~~Plantae.Rhodophyta-Purpureofilum_apyrenoidigerum.ctg37212.p1  ORF type:complete len:230 (-),score=57.64 Plantae.Rhodophyta-Purpureofilum_apyrenoidigerum.ctg37212:269-958(-)
MGKVWIPLESNPDVITRYANELGVGPGFGFSEIFSLDLLDMVPRPVLAVVLLFPLTEKIVSASDEREKHDVGVENSSVDVFFCRQTISNACGTIALLHSISNNMDRISMKPGSFFTEFVEKAKDASPEQRAQMLEADNDLEQVQDRFSKEGDTSVPNPQEVVDTHFIAFVHSNGGLVELDGRKLAPVKHGATSADTLLEDACTVIKEKFMALDPAEVRFTMMALSPSFD